MPTEEHSLSGKVEIQEIKLEYLSKSLEELSKGIEKTNEQIRKIAESILKQEVILTKISAMEEKYSNDYSSIRTSLQTLTKRQDRLEASLNSKPCQTHNVIDKEIEWIKEELRKHNKIFWGVTSFTLTTLVTIAADLIFNKH